MPDLLGAWRKSGLGLRWDGAGRQAWLLGGRRTSGRGRSRVDGDRELDVLAELARQRIGDQGTEPCLELFLDELVGRGDQRGGLDQAKRPGQLQPGTLM